MCWPHTGATGTCLKRTLTGHLPVPATEIRAPLVGKTRLREDPEAPQAVTKCHWSQEPAWEAGTHWQGFFR